MSGPAAIFSAPGLTDPEAAGQWHLSMIGDIATVWQEFTGKGVSVGVYDSGVQYSHWDLDDNYDASKHVVVDGKVYDGDYRPASGAHGTSVAGLIAAERNGRGTVGVAYDAKVTGVNIFDPYSEDDALPGIFINAPDTSKFVEAMRQSVQFDIVNNSWGGAVAAAGPFSRHEPGNFFSNTADAMHQAAVAGRGGLGTVHVSSAGNTPLDGQLDSIKTDRHNITVAAYRQVDGNASSYSTHGAHLLISAPSDDAPDRGGTGVVTTDLLGRDGYNTTDDPAGLKDHTDRFGGTSAAAPIVTGVVALMLDANEGLGWRDVKEILASSARMPVPFETGRTSVDAPGRWGGVETYVLNNSSFKLNAPDANWNGGARHYSTDYGYGALDAHAAVRMAEVWSLFGAAKTSANETGFVQTRAVDMAAPLVEIDPNHFGDRFSGTPASFSFTIDQDISLEHVDLSITYRNAAPGTPLGGMEASMAGLRFKLIGPDGTEAFVDTVGARLAFGSGETSFDFGLAGFRGVMSRGEWTFQFEQDQALTFFNPSGIMMIHGLTFRGFGSAPSADDVYSYTDEYFTMAAIAGEGDRRILSDSDGGTDWINAAAVTWDVDLSLVEGATTRFDGEDAFTIARGSLIEHAVTGDGDDRLIGNALDNRLYGMRGDDWLNGGAGNDTLFGGQGDDVFAFDTAGVSGNDRILDWSFGDRIATSKMLRGADQGGLVTVGSNALVLLDGNSRGDTVELAGQGGAVLQALGRSDGYWWYGFVSEGDEDFVDGRVTEMALGQTGRPAGVAAMADAAAVGAGGGAPAMQDAAFYLYDTMGDAMASGVQTWA